MFIPESESGVRAGDGKGEGGWDRGRTGEGKERGTEASVSFCRLLKQGVEWSIVTAYAARLPLTFC